MRMLLAACLLIWAASAGARPLSLAEVHQLGVYVRCAEQCPAIANDEDYDAANARIACDAACGVPPRLFEKNGIAPVDRVDLDLAILEFQDSQDPDTDLICYRDVDETIVMPAAFCVGAVCEESPACTPQACAAPDDVPARCTDDEPGGPRCWFPARRRPAACPDPVCEARPDRDADDCADADGDQLPAWLEAHQGRDDGVPEAICAGGQACSFDEQCVWDPTLGTGECQPRDCAGACTAFHLELVAEDDAEVLVHVWYDYTPVPARVLDLHLRYDGDALTLQDARPLEPLQAMNKDVSSSHQSDGTARISVFDRDGSHPVPFGPIVELVFARTSDGRADIGFATEDALQVEAVAPSQGDQRAALAEDRLWGPGITLRRRANAPVKLRLWYGFESMSVPQNFSAVPDAATLCDAVADCANAPDAVEQARRIARLDVLQRGDVRVDTIVPGVTGTAARLNGVHDHVRLPVQIERLVADDDGGRRLVDLDPRDQSLSFSAWIFPEGNDPGTELRDAGQVIFSQNAGNEETWFGLRLRPRNARMDLTFFRLDVEPQPADERLLVPAIELRTWHHVGMSLDADTGEAVFYFDGERVGTYLFQQPPLAVACPTLLDGTDVVLHDEGDLQVGGVVPEFLYMAVREANLWGIARMDLAGLDRRPVIADRTASYRDPDYSPFLDRLVYSSDVSGSSEIWMANGDGTNRRQLTLGFGDTARGIQARRPRWAPDGSGIVFESNVYDVPARDNTYARVYHLYYIGFDPVNDTVRIERQSGGVETQLDYELELARQSINDHRLTSSVVDRHHRNARWLRGLDPDADDRGRGQLLVDSADEGLGGNRVSEVRVHRQVPRSTVARRADIERIYAAEQNTQDLKLITAHRSVPREGLDREVERAVVLRRSGEYAPHDLYGVVQRPDEDGLVPVRFRALPIEQPEGCWDRDQDGVRDPEEDRNGDDAVDALDCPSPQVERLFVRFDPRHYTPVLVDDDGDFRELAGPFTRDKRLHLRAQYGDPAAVEINVTSVLGTARPIPSGSTIGTLYFRRRADDQGGAPRDFEALRYVGTEAIDVINLRTGSKRTFDPAGRFERLEDAAFSPAGDQLALSVFSAARPVLLRVDSLRTARDAERIMPDAQSVRGMTWVREARVYPCNWVGGYLHWQNKLIRQGFRGRIDDLKTWGGVRDPDAFRSEAQRGFEFLSRPGRCDSADDCHGARLCDPDVGECVPAPARCDAADDCPRDHVCRRERCVERQPRCQSHAECPDYQLCLADCPPGRPNCGANACQMRGCDPEDPTACVAAGGRCTLRPLAVEQEHDDGTAFDWVCAADCQTDLQCYTQSCLNGPCNFCDQRTHTCHECEVIQQDVNGLQTEQIAGCPDRRSFTCEAGACTTECYLFEDDQSRYLCDPTLEVCQRGRCVLKDWDWTDFAPISFAGLSETRFRRPPDFDNGFGWPGYTQAVDQRIPVEITAYGVGDHQHPPEVAVEVKGGGFYGDAWHRLGAVRVYHATESAARARPYVLMSPYKFTDMRLRLIIDPYANVTAGGNGLRAQDKDFCEDDWRAFCEEHDCAGLGRPCVRRAPGSQANLGYPVGLPPALAIDACQAAERSGCPATRDGEHLFLPGGRSAAAVLDVKVNGGRVLGGANFVSNRVCGYALGAGAAASLSPVDAQGRPRKLVYGNLRLEQSAEQSAYCDGLDCGRTDLVDWLARPDGFERHGYGLLNCTFADGGDDNAEMIFANLTQFSEWPARAGAIVQDTGDVCVVEVDGARVEPCYSWYGWDVSADPHNGAVSVGSYIPFASLEFSTFKSFGHDQGFEVQPRAQGDVTVELAGYERAGLTLNINGRVFAIDDLRDGDTARLREAAAVGLRFEAAIASQPDGQFCAFDGPSAGVMRPEGAELRVRCDTLVPVALAVRGFAEPDRVVLELTTPLGTRRRVFRADGDYLFGLDAVRGQPFSVRIHRAPNRQLCTLRDAEDASAGDNEVVGLTCEQPPTRPLAVNVRGVPAGDTVVVRETGTGRRLTFDADATATFEQPFLIGFEYSIAIERAPAEQACALEGGRAGSSGVVIRNPAQEPDVPQFAARVRCAPLPTGVLNIEVANLASPGLVLGLALDGAPPLLLPVEPAGLGQRSRISTPPMQLGQDYTIAIASQPDDGSVRCEVLNGDGTLILEEAPVAVVCSPVFNDAIYPVGGSIEGLDRDGLELDLNGSRLRVAADAQRFNFANGLPDDTAWAVRVRSAPDGLSCAVSNGVGVLDGAAVDDVVVRCEPASQVHVDLFWPPSDGSGVQALLISDAGRLVGRSADQVQLERGRAVFSLQAIGGDQRAAMPSGTYHLFVFVDHDGLDAPIGGRVTQYRAGVDRGVYRRLRLRAGAAQTVTLRWQDGDASDVPPLTAVELTVEYDEILPQGELMCWWSPAGMAVSIPPERAPPVVGVNRVNCGADGCQRGDEVQGIPVMGLPEREYRATCWLDVDGDGLLSAGDLTGTAENDDDLRVELEEEN